ncbi:BON domain-containing protein [Acidisphaera sp. L21]|uniref:BON domain-containing protein n=1 Tax=Acidisphaera sp. L21 TaxID=1641851 RepID=UPI001C2017B2|nr:BON domain-containing protein [Acidisphaera sp. L21]
MSADRQLQQAVTAELGWEPSVVAAHIGVAANAGVVTLTGHVASFSEKYAAEMAAHRVKGVKAVAEEIEVRLPFETMRTDEEIAGAAIDRLGWDVTIPKDAVKVQVEHGWVTLTGQVDSYYQKDNARIEIRHLFGVKGLSDQISIKPRVDVADLCDEITHALHRSWYFDPKTINVTANGGRIHLTGSVGLLRDKQMAAATAWSAPGVTSVQNDIAVSSSATIIKQGSHSMAQHETLVAIYATHDAAETAIRQVSDGGLDMKHFSIVGRGYHTDEQVTGFYSAGDRVKFWGSRGAYWGGLWGLLFGGMMLTIPVLGPIVVLGSLAAGVFTAITGAVEGAVVMGGLGALGAALFSIGIPHHSVLQYETALKADSYLIVAHGPQSEIQRAKEMLQASGPARLDIHADAPAIPALAA